MGTPTQKCSLCGYSFSLQFREEKVDRDGIIKTETFYSLDPEHTCLGGFEMKLDTPVLEFDPERWKGAILE
jgi:hypothetical protein